MNMKAEIELMLPQAKEWQRLPANPQSARSGVDQILPQSQQKPTLLHPDPRFPASGTLR